MPEIKIVSRYDSEKVLWQGDAVSVRDAVIKSIKQGADLGGAYLYGANLRDADLCGADLGCAYLYGANLRGADLGCAYLYGANLRGADLYDANLCGANLRGANLRGADLRGADLGGAYLYGANLRGADLCGADLGCAYLYGANLRGANLGGVKEDFLKIISTSNEVVYLWKALHDGKINGSTYEGDCACLVGTIANSKDVHYENIEGLKPDSNRPAEKWFLAIKTGDTPDNNPVSAIVRDWIKEFGDKENITLPAREVVWK